MTADALIEKVGGYLDTRPDTAIEATCWFIACHTAAFVLSDYGPKDLARVLQDGESLGGPFKTKEHVEAWVTEMQEDGDWSWLDEALDRHFGVTR